MYESPIDIIQGELHTEMDSAIMKAVQQIGINVDKDELLHALTYDRNQYQLGFLDGKIKAMEEIVHCKDCKHKPYFDENGFVEPSEGKCPCINDDDCYYSWVPEDDYFCADGERREDGGII